MDSVELTIKKINDLEKENQINKMKYNDSELSVKLKIDDYKHFKNKKEDGKYEILDLISIKDMNNISETLQMFTISPEFFNVERFNLFNSLSYNCYEFMRTGYDEPREECFRIIEKIESLDIQNTCIYHKSIFNLLKRLVSDRDIKSIDMIRSMTLSFLNALIFKFRSISINDDILRNNREIDLLNIKLRLIR